MKNLDAVRRPIGPIVDLNCTLCFWALYATWELDERSALRQRLR